MLSSETTGSSFPTLGEIFTRTPVGLGRIADGGFLLAKGPSMSVPMRARIGFVNHLPRLKRKNPISSFRLVDSRLGKAAENCGDMRWRKGVLAAKS